VLSVTDTIPPTFINLSQNITTCDTIIYWTSPNANDNCSLDAVIQTTNPQYHSGSTFPIGSTIIGYTAYDIYGNSDSIQFTVTILPELQPYWSGLPQQFCINDSALNLNDLVTGDTGGIWFIDSSQLSQPLFVPSSQTSGTHTITYLLDNSYCTADSSLTTEIFDIPDVNAGTDTNICGLSYQINGLVNPTDATHYWSAESSYLIFSPDSLTLTSNITAFDFGEYTLILTAFEYANCINTDTINIAFYKMPQPINAGTDQILEFTYETTLNAEIPDIGTGEWSFLQGNGYFSNINDPATLISELSETNNILIWKVVNGPCIDYDTVNITVHGIKIPNGFSPNNDGINDYFVIPGIADHQNELTIFNRWGKEIYHKINYKNNWDGKTQNGKELPEDTYFYILIIDNNTFNGSITISR
ncbi:MAG TPA: T9SS type B sorting domain-containing protein, partial [Bacteroidales bacterium]|nr:T9SS type B sorting domain-containing protein [Bacteroidales bacterium]